ncbi:MAG TPA: hypothetical protein PLD14_03385 [Candidatus Pacearchaeota archaeon]|nr:hypothetical protein [Candidatus Pacearchaeota archaeon]HPR80241.1 hypothetical protein [Candidatus Pacearchaeota archaeon]
MKIESKERIEKEGINFFPLVEVEKELIKDGEFLRTLSLNLHKRGFADFFLKEGTENRPNSIVIWVPVDSAKQIIGICCSKVLQDIYWNNDIF